MNILKEFIKRTLLEAKKGEMRLYRQLRDAIEDAESPYELSALAKKVEKSEIKSFTLMMMLHNEVVEIGFDIKHPALSDRVGPMERPKVMNRQLVDYLFYKIANSPKSPQMSLSL
jgi:hypothetical protein